MIKAEVKTNFNVPSGFIFQKDLKEIADRIFIPYLVRYIDQQRQINGSQYPELEPETIARKTGSIIGRTFTKSGSIRASASKKIEAVGLAGFSNKTLVDTGLLRRSFISKVIGKHSVQITLRDERKEIGEYLQITGVGKKGKKFQFFGISTQMENDAIGFIKEKLKRLIQSGSKR